MIGEGKKQRKIEFIVVRAFVSVVGRDLETKGEPLIHLLSQVKDNLALYLDHGRPKGGDKRRAQSSRRPPIGRRGR